jgi:hypothetical protein
MSDAITRKDLTDLDERQSKRLTEMEERLIESDERLGKRLTEIDERLGKRLTEMDERWAKRSMEMEERWAKRWIDTEERLVKYVDQRSEQVENKLLTAFHGWSRSMEIRVRGTSTAVMGFDERLALAEERIGDLERWKGSQPSK